MTIQDLCKQLINATEVEFEIDLKKIEGEVTHDDIRNLTAALKRNNAITGLNIIGGKQVEVGKQLNVLLGVFSGIEGKKDFKNLTLECMSLSANALERLFEVAHHINNTLTLKNCALEVVSIPRVTISKLQKAQHLPQLNIDHTSGALTPFATVFRSIVFTGRGQDITEDVYNGTILDNNTMAALSQNQSLEALEISVPGLIYDLPPLPTWPLLKKVDISAMRFSSLEGCSSLKELTLRGKVSVMRKGWVEDGSAELLQCVFKHESLEVIDLTAMEIIGPQLDCLVDHLQPKHPVTVRLTFNMSMPANHKSLVQKLNETPLLNLELTYPSDSFFTAAFKGAIDDANKVNVAKQKLIKLDALLAQMDPLSSKGKEEARQMLLSTRLDCTSEQWGERVTKWKIACGVPSDEGGDNGDAILNQPVDAKQIFNNAVKSMQRQSQKRDAFLLGALDDVAQGKRSVASVLLKHNINDFPEIRDLMLKDSERIWGVACATIDQFFEKYPKPTAALFRNDTKWNADVERSQHFLSNDYRVFAKEKPLREAVTAIFENMLKPRGGVFSPLLKLAYGRRDTDIAQAVLHCLRNGADVRTTLIEALEIHESRYKDLRDNSCARRLIYCLHLANTEQQKLAESGQQPPAVTVSPITTTT